MKSQLTDNHKNWGFSLVELMVTLVVIAILATVAFPSYQNHVISTKRKKAMNSLMSHATVIERFRANHGFNYRCLSLQASTCTLNGKTMNLPPVVSDQLPTDVPTPDYALSITVTPDFQSYVITATPLDTSTQKNDGDIKLHSNGKREWAGLSCWPIDSKDCR